MAAALNNPKGILLMGIAMAFFGAADTVAKFFSDLYPTLQVVGMRQMGLMTGVIVYALVTRKLSLRTDQVGLQLLRGVFATSSAFLFVLGLSFIPLADATAIAFVAPLFVTVMGYFILGEPVGLRRWTAVVIGFMGTLIIIRPGFSSFEFGHVFIVCAASLFAARQIISRFLSSTDNTMTTVAYTAITSAGILLAIMPFVWQPIQSLEHLGLFILFALTAGAGEILVIKALEIAHAVVVAPLQYTILIWVTMYGFLFLGVFPDGLTFLGAFVIMASGGYTLLREHQVKKAAQRRS
jgi:drug/metabolite transporter (DMT)-like permease